MKANYERQMEILPPTAMDFLSVSIIGTGGIGAGTALALGKLGIRQLYFYDPDDVEDVNIPTQLLGVSDIGKSKVASLIGVLQHMTEASGVGTKKRIGPTDTLPGKIIISALDSLGARQTVWPAVVASAPEWYIDARMGAQMFQLFCVDMKSVGDAMPTNNWYENYLMGLQDGDVEDEPCTARATIYTAFLAAGHIAHQVKLIAMEQRMPKMLVHDIKNFSLFIPAWIEAERAYPA